MKRYFVAVLTVLALGSFAFAEEQIEYSPYINKSFSQKAPEDYLPMPREWESSAGEVASYDNLDLLNEQPSYLGVGEFLPQDARLTAQANAYSSAFDTMGPIMPALQQEGGSGGSTEALTAEQQEAMIAEALANPLSYLWLGFMQNDVINYEGRVIDALGEKDIVNNTTIIMPVLSIQLAGDSHPQFPDGGGHYAADQRRTEFNTRRRLQP